MTGSVRTGAAPAEPVLDARYGRSSVRRRRDRRVLLVAVAAVVVVFLAWVVWAGLASPAASVDADDTAHTIHGARSVDVSFQVSTAPGTRVACAVEAQSEDFAVVGWRIVEIPASDRQIRSFTEHVLTTQQAVTGLISSCWAT